MKILLKNGQVIDVINNKLVKTDVLIEDDKIVDLGTFADADITIDCRDKFISPGFIDGHIHIESTMLRPYEFAKTVIPHGTVAVVTDPHEITNVCSLKGLDYMLQDSKNLPLDFYFMLPSCVPATCFDESKEVLNIEQLDPYFNKERVLGLAEMMNYPGVIYKDPEVIKKLKRAKELNKIIDGHAPLLTGADLDTYISYGIDSDHECTNANEAIEKLTKGQWIMIRNGTAAKNLEALMPLLDLKYKDRCLFATDDKESSELMNGHIDSIIKEAIKRGADPIISYQVATINAAKRFRLDNTGAILKNYKANVLILDSLDDVIVNTVIFNGNIVYDNGKLKNFEEPIIDNEINKEVMNSMNCTPITKDDIKISIDGSKVRVIDVVPKELLTNELIASIKDIGVVSDILKICVVERHKNTNHIGVGYIHGIGLKNGAISSTISHDSHNIIAIGTNDDDIVTAINRTIEIGGGNVIINNGKVIDELCLPIAGLMSTLDAKTLSIRLAEVRNKVYDLGVNKNIAPFMNMAFISLPVIPHLKLTTMGLIDVDKFSKVPLFIK